MRMTRSAVLLVALGVAVPAASEEVEFQYEMVPEKPASSPLKGFEMGPATLYVRLKERGHVYIVTGDGNGSFRIAYPTGAPSAAVQSRELPPVKLVHVTGTPGVQRVYLVVSRQPVPELEDAARKGASIEEAVPLGVRNRSLGEGTYSRDLKGNLTTVRLKTDGKPTVVEEISLLRGGTSQ